MSKVTWILVVSVFADVCNRVQSHKSEMPEFFKDLEALISKTVDPILKILSQITINLTILTRMGMMLDDHRQYNKETEQVKFEELRNGYSPKISEPYTETIPLNGLTTENREAESLHPELAGLRYGGHDDLDKMEPTGQNPGPVEVESMKGTDLGPGSGDNVDPIDWQLDNGQDLGQSVLVGGQVPVADQGPSEKLDPDVGGWGREAGGSSYGGQGFDGGLSIDRTPLPSFGQNEGQAHGSGWSMSEAPPSSRWWPEGNFDQGGVKSPDVGQSPGSDYSPVESGRVIGWIPGQSPGSSIGRNLVGLSGLRIGQRQRWRPGLRMRSGVGMHPSPVSDLDQKAPSGAVGPPKPGGSRSQGGTSAADVPGGHRRSLVQGIKNDVHGANTRRQVEDFIDHPTRKPGIKTQRTKYPRLFKPGQSLEDNNEWDSTENPLKFLPKQTTNHPPVVYDPSMREDQVPEYKGGKMPGPGSESEYPNGFRMNYAYLPNTNTELGKPSALRQGFPSMGDYANPTNQNNALRMGGQGSPRLGAGGNIGSIPPPGYKQVGQPPGIGGVPPPGYKQAGQPPGMGGIPPPGYKQAGQPPGMGGIPPPGYKQAEQPSGIGRITPPGYKQAEQPSGIEGGPPPGYMQGKLPGIGGGAPPGYLQEGQPPWMEGGAPPGYMQGKPPGIGSGPPSGYGEQPPGMGRGYLPEYLQRGSPLDRGGYLTPEYMQRGQPPRMRRGIPQE